MTFEGFTQSTIDFMWNLRLNNNKSWFEAHKDEYQYALQTPMKTLAQDVFAQLADDCDKRGLRLKVSRIYKDARRVRDGEPYRDHLWFSLEKPSGEYWANTPVFWFELDPEGWSYGLGYYMAAAETMAKLRARIDRAPKVFERFIAPLAKQSEFTLEGDEYKRKKGAPTPKAAAWYNKKTFSLIHNGRIENMLFSPELTARIIGGFTFLMPFYDYFSTLPADPRELPPSEYASGEFERAVRELVSNWEKLIGVTATFVGIRRMSSRWGSCTAKTRRIRLNAALEYCSRECLEYVIVHELAHLQENNHSPHFWSIVASALPDYKDRQAKLSELAWLLNAQGGE
jgi:uncharacterized protein (TIGR02453 family)